MKGKFPLTLVLLVVVSLIMASCAPQATPAATQPPAPAATQEAQSEEPVAGQEQVVTIGFTASQTGSQNVSSVRQLNGFNLWMKQVNDAGGIQLGDGAVVKFDSVSYDDESNKERVQELYTRLVSEDNADFLISPYSSGLTAAAAVIAEQYGKVMVTTGAADDETYKQGYTQIFQLYTPGSRYLLGAIDLLGTLDSGVKKIAFVFENDKFSTSVVEGARPYAEEKGYEVVLFEGYATETTDFGPIINKIQESGAEAVLGGGHFPDGSTFARQMFEKNTAIKFLSVIVAAPDTKFAELGDAAVNVTGPSQWELKASHTEEEAQSLGMDWYGPSGEDFIQGYQSAYNEEPTYHAAGGYAAGLVLQYAIESADSTDPEAIKTVLDDMNLMTFYGGIKFDTTPDNHGLQIGHSMVLTQWQKDASGELVREVVWPADVATADAAYPLR